MSVAIRPRSSRVSVLMILIALLSGVLLPLAGARAVDQPVVDHLVVSELATGGASASDELIELYNPAPTPLPLEGLELIYVSSTGTTISRRAAWDAGASVVPPGGHVLVANEAGTYAAVADALYATGMAATGGSVALRVQGAGSAIDAVGWGTAAGTWHEGTNAAPPGPGASLERLPGGALGSTQDTDDNAVDFVERPTPEPQNLASPPTPAPDGASPTPAPIPTGSPEPTISPDPEPTATATPTSPPSTPLPTATPGTAPIPVATARSAPDGAIVTVEATALTASDFHDGGGFVADASGGIAVLVEDGSFARGSLLRVTGSLDDRFSQRTIRAAGTDVVVLGPGAEPEPIVTATGSVNESIEGRLVRVAGAVTGSPTTLTSGIAFDVDDGSGNARVIVPIDPAIDLSAWTAGTRVDVIGVMSQRDSTGSGTAGYRVMPRDPGDIVDVGAGPSPTPSPSASTTVEPSPTPGDPGDGGEVVPVSLARLAPKNARVRVRGVVTLAPGTVDPATAAIQDETGAIVLRLADEAGTVAVGERIEVAGTRSTKSGMETLRVADVPLRLGVAAEPQPQLVRTGGVGEAHEAVLVVARGALVAAARRASSGTVSFEMDDGSGPLRVSLASSLEADDEELVAGTWVEVRGVLGQETTGAQPLRGYRIWPRTTADLRLLSTPAAGEASGLASAGTRGSVPTGSLGDAGGAELSALRVGATLVAGPWAELEVGGLLWDGSRLVAIAAGSSEQVVAIARQHPLPAVLELGGMRAIGTEARTGAALVSLGSEPGEVVLGDGPPAPPRATLAAAQPEPVWASLVGRLADDGRTLALDGRRVSLDRRCADDADAVAGIVVATGVAVGDPVRLIVPCGAIRAAPALIRASLPPVSAIGEPAARIVGERAGSDSDPRRPIVAGLLLLGAVMLAGAAVAGRRMEPDPAVEIPDDQAIGASEDDAARGLPHLTLVGVPHERSP